MIAKAFTVWCWLCTTLLVVVLSTFSLYIAYRAAPSFGTNLFFGNAEVWAAITGKAPVWEGIWPACIGTLSVTLLALALALIPGIATGIWLSEFTESKLNPPLGIAVDLLAGVPSILMGLCGFALILQLRATVAHQANACLLVSAACLALLILPYLANTTRAALQALPTSLKLTSSALGLSRWQTLRHILLPRATKGIISGVVLSMGRAAEDTAVIMLTGAVANAGLPSGLFERYEALPFTIFYYSAQYQNPKELELAFGAALTLIFFTASTFTLTGIIYQKSFAHHEN